MMNWVFFFVGFLSGFVTLIAYACCTVGHCYQDDEWNERSNESVDSHI